jgi:hypothetical protein
MNKTKLKLAAASLAMFTGLSTTQAGVVNGGGGKGVVCRNSDQSIKSVEVLDLWEARTLRDAIPEVSTGPLAEVVDSALQRLAFAFAISEVKASEWSEEGKLVCSGNDCLLHDLRKTASQFLFPSKEVRRLRGVRLELTPDSMEQVHPDDCAIEQIVNYQPSRNDVLINQELFEKMDRTNQAALIAHEALYKSLREAGNESNSLRVRRAIGFIFSGENKFTLPTSVQSSNGFISCTSKDLDQYGTPLTILRFSKDYTQLNFVRFAGQLPMGTIVTKSEDAIGTPKSLQLFVEAKCGGDGYMDDTSFLDGPVEFDRPITLALVCKNRKKELRYSFRAPGETVMTNVALVCKAQSKKGNSPLF